MTPSEAAGRAFWIAEHPNVDPSCWDLLNDYTRQQWIAKGQPIADAAAAEAFSEGYLAGLINMEYYSGPIRNPYRMP